MNGVRLVGGDTMNYWISDHRENLLKTIAEWDFLLAELQSRLAPGGKIYLTVNPLPDGKKYLTREVRDLFLTRGADIERERIFFKQGVRF